MDRACSTVVMALALAARASAWGVGPRGALGLARSTQVGRHHVGRHGTSGMTTLMSGATAGDLVKVNWSVKMEGGEPLPAESQVFDQGEVSLVVGAGGYLPCLHSAVTELEPGASKVTHHPALKETTNPLLLPRPCHAQPHAHASSPDLHGQI